MTSKAPKEQHRCSIQSACLISCAQRSPYPLFETCSASFGRTRLTSWNAKRTYHNKKIIGGKAIIRPSAPTPKGNLRRSRQPVTSASTPAWRQKRSQRGDAQLLKFLLNQSICSTVRPDLCLSKQEMHRNVPAKRCNTDLNNPHGRYLNYGSYFHCKRFRLQRQEVWDRLEQIQRIQIDLPAGFALQQFNRRARVGSTQQQMPPVVPVDPRKKAGCRTDKAGARHILPLQDFAQPHGDAFSLLLRLARIGIQEKTK